MCNDSVTLQINLFAPSSWLFFNPFLQLLELMLVLQSSSLSDLVFTPPFLL